VRKEKGVGKNKTNRGVGVYSDRSVKGFFLPCTMCIPVETLVLRGM